MRIRTLFFLACTSLGLAAGSASAAPSITGVAGCILKEYTKLGTDGWDVFVDTNYSGNTGAGTRINACQSNMARNINFGNFATANEINNAFYQMELQTIETINDRIIENRSKIELNIKDPAQTATNPNAGVILYRSKAYEQVTAPKALTTNATPNEDLTALGGAFK